MNPINTKRVFLYTLTVIAAAAFAYLLLASSRILIVLLLAIIIASALRIFVVRLRNMGLSEGLSIVLVYGILLVTLIALFAIVLPPIVNQFADYLQSENRVAARLNFAQSWFAARISDITGSQVATVPSEEIDQAVTSLTNDIRATIPNMFGSVGATLGEAILAFVMGVYWLTSRDNALAFVTQLFPLNARGRVQAAIEEIEVSLGSFLRGMVFVAVFVGIANFVLLTIFRVPNAATLAFVIGASTMLPVVGGFIGGFGASFLALLGGLPVHALITFGTFVAVQQIETHYLTPRVMSRSVGVDPLLVIVGIFTGFALLGVIGGIIAIPVLGTIATLVRYTVLEPRREHVKSYVMEEGVMILRTGDEAEEPSKAGTNPTDPKPSVLVP
jgi:predicted PurR-regulated permease PerM